MALKSPFSGLVPCRFLCMLAHLVILISIFIRRDEYNLKCDSSIGISTKDLDAQLITALSLSITFLVVEIISFMIGLSLFNTFQSILSSLVHSAAAISLSFMIFNSWCTIDIWPVFAICSCLPLLTEFVYLIGIWIFKRAIN